MAEAEPAGQWGEARGGGALWVFRECFRTVGRFENHSSFLFFGFNIIGKKYKLFLDYALGACYLAFVFESRERRTPLVFHF